MLFFASCLLLLASCESNPTVDESEDAIAQYLSLSLEERQSSKHAVEALQTSDDLEVSLFASEPMVINPTNLTVDARGRVWVCESYNYDVPESEQKESGGKISILEDTDRDGVADKKTVFYQGDDVHLALGIAVLGSKVFVSRSPNLLVFTDDDGDDIPELKDTIFTGMGGPGDHSAHSVVFGPDGKYYFNYGNAGIRVLQKDGSPIKDRSGYVINSHGRPFHGGMVFRFDEGGENLEVLGHNFRNNYEVDIDAFGTLWQSDNDDDGNKGVRINYVMEYGNFGYRDELTGAFWSRPRVGMHDSIPIRHWHQNDPGVVPNMLYTGAGSPAGILAYEGDLLPDRFQNHLIHADAGPNVVRAYITEKEGAGYKASIQPILHSDHDQWFRPVDVSIAPDGSLFVADWYDPIVGGGAAGDREKGRIYRVAPKGHKYEPTNTDMTLSMAIERIGSANQSERFDAWQTVYAQLTEAESSLHELFTKESDATARVRALWLLAKSSAATKYISEGLSDEDPDIRVAALRMARQSDMDIIKVLKEMKDESSPEVLREMAIALRYEKGAEKAAIWSDLASKYKGDRWYLEALGIGANEDWDLCFDAWLSQLGPSWNHGTNRDIVWRSRAEAALPLLTDLIEDLSTSPSDRLKYFRAFDFFGPEKNPHLIKLLDTDHTQRQDIILLALQQIDAENITVGAGITQALNEVLSKGKPSWEAVDLIKKYQQKDKVDWLLSWSADAANPDIGLEAMGVLTDPAGFDAFNAIEERIYNDPDVAVQMIQSMRSSHDGESMALLKKVVLDGNLEMPIRRAAVEVLGSSWGGEDHLLETVTSSEFPTELKPLAGSILFSVYRQSIRDEAEKYLERPSSGAQKDLPPLRVLVATVGSADKGADVFTTYCATCHKYGSEGVDFGPALTEISNKMDREGLFRSIIYPGEGVSFGYETIELTLKDGSKVVGLLANETQTEVQLKLVGDIIQTFATSDIASKTVLPQSLMTDLTPVLTQEELVDLVAFLSEAQTI